MIKKVAKWFGAVYLFCFLVTLIHFPSSIKNVTREEPMFLPLTPIAATLVAKSYFQLFRTGIWPWASPADTVTLNDLIDESGIESSPYNRKLLSVNVEDKIWSKGLNYQLNSESYAMTPQNAAMPQPIHGGIVRVGRYFCQGNSDRSGVYNRLFGPLRCVRLSRSRGTVYWHELGDSMPRKVRFRDATGYGLG